MTANPVTEEQLLNSEEPAGGGLLTAAELEHLAELTAGKIAEGILRLPESVRGALVRCAGAGYYLPFIHFGIGQDAHQLRAYVRQGSLQLDIYDVHGTRQWSAVIA